VTLACRLTDIVLKFCGLSCWIGHLFDNEFNNV